MKERINGILSEVKTKIAAAASENELQSVKAPISASRGR